MKRRKPRRKGQTFMGEVGEMTPQWVYLNHLSIPENSGVKKVLWYAMHNISSCLNLINTRQLGKNQSLNQFFSLNLLLHYWFFINLQISTEWEFVFLNTNIIILSLIYSLNIPLSNPNISSHRSDRSHTKINLTFLFQ